MKTEQGRILIVNDDKIGDGSLSSQMEIPGHSVVAVNSGREALDEAKAQPFDLVLLNVVTSGAEGVRSLKELKGSDAFQQTPVIALIPVNEFQESAARWFESGAEDVISKPFNSMVLQRRVASMLKTARLSDQVRTYTEEIKEMKKMTDDFMLSILPLGVALSAERNFDRLSERVVLEAQSISNADGGTLYLRTEDDQLRFAIMRTTSLEFELGGTTGNEIPFPPLRLYDEETGEANHKNVATHVALDGRSVNIPDIYQAEGFDFSGTRTFDKQTGYRSMSSLTVPLKNHENEVIGVLQLLNAQDQQTGEVILFTPYLQQVTESLASQAAVALNNQLLLQRQRQLLKIERDMEIAREIQAGFLPEELLQPDGWEIAARFHPARQVSGDFYDVFPLPGNRVGFVIADVVDKGVGAALFMALFRSLIRAFSEQSSTNLMAALPGNLGAAPGSATNQRLATLLTNVNALNTIVLTNNYITRNHGKANMFATMFFGVLEPTSGLLTYINCGHNPPMLLGSTGVKARLTLTGPAVGMLPDVGFDIEQIQFEPGDLLMMFTDGVPEARAADGEFFTEKRLLSMVEQAAPSADALLERIDTSLQAHTGHADQFDDITMLALRRKPVPTEEPQA